MASVTTSTGNVITLGDKVKCPDGTVIKVEGALVAKKFYRLEDCAKVPPETPTTREDRDAALVKANADAIARGEPPVKGVSGGQSGGDNIVWGS